jgi:enoyl-CoA hydratase/carnithine racemase
MIVARANECGCRCLSGTATAEGSGRHMDLDLEWIIGRRECVIVLGERELRGDAVACALHSDYFVMHADATLVIDTPRAWSGVVWRMGRRALRLTGTTLTAADAKRHALCDAVDVDVEWIGSRSAVALDSAASLLARRGGDALERAEFARLFAAGEPQRGLTAFLEKRRRS